MKTRFFTLLAVFTAFRLLASPGADKEYSAHEWGTFTSVQGADGRQLEWNPLIVSELPGFVYDVVESRGNERGTALRRFASKISLRTLQRMETPVIYFYAATPQTLDVRVQFPQGFVTEWYPTARAVDWPSIPGQKLKRDEIFWDQVHILAPTDTTELPSDGSGSHYFAARGAEANRVQVRGAAGRMETEKFLFYRGLGDFRAPLTVTLAEGARELTVKNEGTEPLRHLLVLQLREGQGAFQRVDPLAPGERATIRLTEPGEHRAQSILRTDLRSTVEQALVAEGLFPAEAAAMVATWDDSWFTETGLRVLYTLPTAWTERMLPLTLTPPPRETPVRVMVGRAEVITPAQELALGRQVQRYFRADVHGRREVVQAVRSLNLGRFLEPAMGRVLASTPTNPEFRKRANELLEETIQAETVVAKR